MFFPTASAVMAKREKLREAEATLLSYSASFAPECQFEIETLDSPIPRSCLTSLTSSPTEISTPTPPGSPTHILDWCGSSKSVDKVLSDDSEKDACTCETAPSTSYSSGSSTDAGSTSSPTPPAELPADIDNDPETLVIHSIHVTSEVEEEAGCNEPLVLLHGYMNGSAYFYRNFAGLSKFYREIFSVDLLGWGLSSRPPFPETSSVGEAEHFFVSSLEAWRDYHKIERMVLAGHSLGGYLSVAYAEQYPERVYKLVMLSPIGVPEENHPGQVERRMRLQSSWAMRAAVGVVSSLFNMGTIGGFLRTLPSSQARNASLDYVTGRLPEVADTKEQQLLADYLYFNNILPGSGEWTLQRLLSSTVVAHKPLQHRVPALLRQKKVKSVSFIYGTTDWMDVSAAVSTAEACRPEDDISVHVCRNSGHLLMLQNPHGFNVGLILTGMKDADSPIARDMAPIGQRPEQHWPIIVSPDSIEVSEVDHLSIKEPAIESPLSAR